MPQPPSMPLTRETILDVVAQLRAQLADETYERVDEVSDEALQFLVDLLEMPVGNLLAAAELEGQRRARSIEATLAECDDGTCPISTEVTGALLEVGPWSEIDGDGDVASVLADHVRELGRWYALGRRLVDYVGQLKTMDPGSDLPLDDELVQRLTETHLELAELFDDITERRQAPAAAVPPHPRAGTIPDPPLRPGAVAVPPDVKEAP